MGRTNRPILSSSEAALLEEMFKKSPNHTLRQRCQIILLKAAGRTSADVGAALDLCHVSINGWVKRYQAEGIAGLTTKPGRGRKPQLTVEQDGAWVVAAVQANRQRIALAKAEWEAQQTNKKAISLGAFRAFLKVLAADTTASGGS